MSMPSREFFVRQAVLNAAARVRDILLPGETVTEFLRTQEYENLHPGNFYKTLLYAGTCREFNKLLSQYQRDAA